MATNGDRRTRINVKTAAEWTSANPVLQSGEFGHESDTKKLKVGDGSTAWASLSYISSTTDTSSATNFTGTLQVNGSDVTTDADIGTTIQAYDANLTGFVTACNLPTADGTADQVLKTDGNGTISFATQSGGSLADQGVTSSAAELNVLDGMTATTAELNVLDGITATTAELNYMDGVTSNVQTQLDGKQPLDTNLSSFLSAINLPTSDGTDGQVLTTDGAGNVAWESVSGGAADLSSTNLSALANVSTTSPTNGQVLSYNTSTSQWEPGNAGQSTGAVIGSAKPIQLADGSGGFAADTSTYPRLTWSSSGVGELRVGHIGWTSGNNSNTGYVATWGLTGVGGSLSSGQVTSPSIYIRVNDGSQESHQTVLGFDGQVSGSGGTRKIRKYGQLYGELYSTQEDDYGYQGISTANNVGGYIKNGKVIYRDTTLTGGSGTQTYDCEYGFNFIHDSPAGDWTVNLTKTKTGADNNGNMSNNSSGVWSNGYHIQVKILVKQGNTAYMPTALQVEGTSLTIDWEGNSAPSGTANGKDIVTFDIYHGSTIANSIVLGSSKSFGGV